MEPYMHDVKYYETDKMGITHHSNYIRWMEEARVDFMSKIGWGYDKMEEMGIISPVTAVNCQYKKSTTFNDTVLIKTDVKEYKGVRIIISYEMRNLSTEEIVFTGTSEHCFLKVNGHPLRLKKDFPAFDSVLQELLQTSENN